MYRSQVQSSIPGDLMRLREAVSEVPMCFDWWFEMEQSRKFREKLSAGRVPTVLVDVRAA